jgi:hypothetical protein
MRDFTRLILVSAFFTACNLMPLVYANEQWEAYAIMLTVQLLAGAPLVLPRQLALHPLAVLVFKP